MQGLNTTQAAPDPGQVTQALAQQGGDAGNCWVQAANKYRLPPYLLFAIAMVESELNPTAVNRNSNASTDYGYMQINSWWLPTLKNYGIEKNHLYDPCVSIHVGAWVLAHNFYRMGYSWNAIGAYNANDSYKRWVYAQKVYAMHHMLVQWGQAYRDAYEAQKGNPPAFVIKPPESWIQYARENARRSIRNSRPT